MAYDPTVWQGGKRPPAISPPALNKIEKGIKDAHDALGNTYTKGQVDQLVADSGTSVTGSVATVADLPAPEQGKSFIVTEEVALYVAHDGLWQGPFPIEGNATDVAVASLVGDASTTTRTTLDRAYFAESDTPPPMPAVGQRWLDTSDDSLMVPSPVTLIGDRWMAGAVPPNGVVTASVGTRYTDTARTAGALEWIKETGTGNTGWAVAEGSTGWRNITANVTGSAGGSLLILREGNTVWMDFQSLVVSTTDQTSLVISGVIPAGFRPPRDAQVPLGPRVHDATNELKGSVRVYPTGNIALYRVPGNGWARGVVAFRCSEPWPTALPGAAA